jgi:mRNA interferase RelE/StbE
VAEIRILPAAVRELERLDKPVARRIVERINWLATNLEDLKPDPLTGNLEGFYKLRVGHYRVIYELLSGKKIIVIHQIGHRREIYKK